MKPNRNLKLLIVLIIIVFVMTQAPRALAISDEVIKQRIEDKAADTFRLRGSESRSRCGRWLRRVAWYGWLVYPEDALRTNRMEDHRSGRG